MFIDYYAVLQIDINATQDDIKLAFKKQALKWHPDKNPDIDTTKRMQEINEAYLILKDIEARERYNVEYRNFKKFQQDYEKNDKYYNKQNESSEENKKEEKSYTYYEYHPKDDILNNWIKNAKKQAVELAKQTINDFKGMSVVGVKEAAKGAGNQFIYQLIIGVIFLTIFSITKSCD